MFKTLSIITAQALAFVSLEATVMQIEKMQGSDDAYQWLFKDDGNYTFSNNFSQGISGGSGKGVIGIYSTATNTYTLGTNSHITFTSISNSSSQALKTAQGIYSSGNTTLLLEQSSNLTFQSISSTNSASYGIYSNKGETHITLQENSRLNFNQIAGESAYGFWSFYSSANTLSIHKDATIKFGSILGELDAYGINSINSGGRYFPRKWGGGRNYFL